jgi:hypothetical protein
MPNLNVQFNGQTLIRPGAYYIDDVSGVNGPLATVPPLLVVGYGYGTPPLTPTNFTTEQAFLNAVRGGPVGAFAPFIFTPSGQLNGASLITFINVGENTQSTLTLNNSSAVPSIKLTSYDYGAPSNLLQAQVSAGSIAGSLITLYDGYANTESQGDNLGVPFQMAYLGSATTVTFTVTQVASGATQLTITSPNVGESVSIPLSAATYATVSAVVEYLNGTGYYAANTISATNGALASTSLDACAAIPLPQPTAGTPNYVNVTSILPDPIYWVNQFNSGMAKASVASGGTSSRTESLAVLPLTHFTGGTSVPPVLADYANGLNLGLTQAAFVVFCDSNSIGVQSLGAQHAIQASSVSARRPRRFITGSSIGDTVTQTLTNIKPLNSIQSTYCYPGIYNVSTTTGLNTLYGGLYVAAAVAGMLVGNPIATALTNKSISGTGVEVFLSDAQINTLQQGGCLPVVTSNAGTPLILSDFTCWLNDANPENVFNQQVGIRQYLEYVLIGACQPYVGTIASTFGLARVRNAVVAALNAEIYTPGGGNGVLSSWDASSLVLSYTGDNQTLAIQVSVTPVGQFRFILITVAIQQLNLAG